MRYLYYIFISMTDVGEKDFVRIQPLGAGNEVGRSCFLLEYQRSGISGSLMLDCGINPSISEGESQSDIPALPFFDLLVKEKDRKLRLPELQCILISHFHSDHANGLPSLLMAYEKSGQQIPPIYMTQQTKDILDDSFSEMLKNNKIFPQISEQDRKLQAQKAIDLINQHTQIKAINEPIKFANGLVITPRNAGHVQGAAMFIIDINNYTILYTGDYSMEKDRTLAQADIPKFSPDILITEGTYGTLRHHDRKEREKTFISKIENVLRSKNGKVLLPVFGVGRV